MTLRTACQWGLTVRICKVYKAPIKWAHGAFDRAYTRLKAGELNKRVEYYQSFGNVAYVYT